MGGQTVLVPIRARSTGRWPRRIEARRQIHNAFDRWYRANQDRFAIRLEFIRRTDKVLSFGFAGIDRAINCALIDDEILVLATCNHNGVAEDCDYLIWIDTVPVRVVGGYVCDLCDPDTRPVVPDRATLWRIALFEVLLNWTNDVLTQADAVRIVRDGGMVSARLVRRSDTSDSDWVNL
jgi:hypothetical protein